MGSQDIQQDQPQQQPGPKQPSPELLTPGEARQGSVPVPKPTKEAQQEAREVYGHKERTQKRELGAIGWIFGSRSEKPGNIAAIVVLACFVLLFFGFFWLKGSDPAALKIAAASATPIEVSDNLPESFFKLLSALMGVTGLALGYLFGSGAKSSRDKDD